MEEGEPAFSNPQAFSGPSAGEDVPSSSSMDSFLESILNDGQHHTCTHTHSCNPPGPDLSHTHTCFHVHTKILSAPLDETSESMEKSSPMKKRPRGNREAVRKYREKKKAHAATLEEEIAQLRAINQQLTERLHGQAALEAEVTRLKCLLADLRGRIEGEIGSFPYKKPVKGRGDFASGLTQANMTGMGGARAMNSCGFHCDDPNYCPYNVGENGAVNGQVLGFCDIINMQGIGRSTCAAKDCAGCGPCGNGVAARPVDCSSNGAEMQGLVSFRLLSHAIVSFFFFDICQQEIKFSRRLVVISYVWFYIQNYSSRTLVYLVL